MRAHRAPSFLHLMVALSLGAIALGAPSCKERGTQGGKGGKGDRGGAVKTRAYVADPAAAARSWLPPGSRYRVDGAPRTYDKETVFDLLNGGADALLEAGLVSLLHVRLRDEAQIFMDCEIQVMDVRSPAKAKAMLRKEKAPESKPEKLGDEGFVEPTTALFAKGRHLVRVMALPLGSRKSAPVVEIARRIEATPKAAW